ncbi:hypothetical protein ACIA5A_05990 [Micromonospora sp. NPDC051300]|uniref:hypothetical protein n=1 Tax=Micromonospora sp. NPDC051300 TaxID=3364286 RepID=UPI0037889999
MSIVGVTSGNTAAGTSASLATSYPAGWQADDVVVLIGGLSGVALTMSTPVGFTLLPGPSWPVAEGSNSRMYAWSRTLQASDTEPTISASGAMTGGWIAVVLRGVSGVAQAATATASGTSVTLPTLPGVVAGSGLVAAAHCRVVSGTVPGNLTFNVAYTEQSDTATSRSTGSANVRAAAATRTAATAGAYGGETVTSDVTGSMIGLLVEVTAAGVDATVGPVGLAVPVAVGSPSVVAAVTTTPDGVAVPVTLGGPTAAWSAETAPGGVVVPVETGEPGAAWTADAAPDGQAVPVQLGQPAALWSTVAAPQGVAVPIQVGQPGVGGPPPPPPPAAGGLRLMAGETVVILRASLVDGPYGNQSRDWENAARVDSPGWGFAPRAGDEQSDPEVPAVIAGLTGYGPPTADVQPTDRMEVRGQVYEVVGEVGLWRSPLTGWAPGVEVALRRVYITEG